MVSTFATILVVIALAFVLMAFFKQKICFAPKNVKPGITKPRKPIRESLGFKKLKERPSMKIEPMTVKIITKQFQNLETESGKTQSKPRPPLPPPSLVQVHHVEENKSPNLLHRIQPRLPPPPLPTSNPIPHLNNDIVRKFDYVEKNPSPQPSPKFVPKPMTPKAVYKSPSPTSRPAPTPTFKPVQNPAAPFPVLRPVAPRPVFGSPNGAQGSMVSEMKRNLERNLELKDNDSLW